MKLRGTSGLVVVFIAILAWGIALQFLPSNTTTWNYAYNVGYALLYAVGAVVGIWGAYYVTTEISMGRALLWLGLSQLSYVVGLLIWAYYNLVARVSVPYPSWADLFFMLFYPLLAVGTWYFLTMVASHMHTRYLFEALGIFFVAAIVIVGFLNTPDFSGPIVTRIINLWYPLGDSLLITLSYLVFRAGREKFQFGVFVLILGLLIQVCADIIFSYRTNANLYWNGDVSDILFAISGFVVTLAILNIFFDFVSSGESAKETA